MATSPQPVFRSSMVSTRFPQFSGTGGSVCSAPFVLNKDLTAVTDSTAADIIKPWEIFAGTLDGAGTPNIIPIGVPGEYSKLEIWIVSQATIASQAEPILSVYGRQAIPDAAQSNMPHAYDSANFPKVSEWWNPLVFVDRAVDRLNSSTDEIGAGIPHAAIATSARGANSTGSYQMQAFQFTLNQRCPGLGDDQIGSGSPLGDNLAVYGTDFFCGPMTSMFLDGADTVMATVHGAAGGASMLMGRFTA